ncbi:BREX-1 system adenine-specific DNA-methyltransferase PglX [Carnobacterium gallinarum]|uniref:BREX-1 system adenine-specific DNA-methyltransferase PglX n=1 Tax=Carnobacterium gallinarum TaxID=2749 RepID=UPI000692093A|nr:BREX-1 system adenine-specific DNA-methyltransferase PglX [Carnobacterium gallinarum]
MNKAALKKFATQTRTQLMTGVRIRASAFGCTSEGLKEVTKVADQMVINGVPMDKEERKLYQKLVVKMQKYQKSSTYESAYERLIEEVAYTWFNRIIALRYMEFHDYLPIRMLLLSSRNPLKKEPDALTHAMELVDVLHLDSNLVWQLKSEQKTDKLFKYLLIQQSKQLGDILPSAFSTVDDVEELLLPDYLLNEHQIIDNLMNETDKEDWENVEIIGWLYQYYHAEVKEQVGGSKNSQVAKQHLPVVTQVFTPKWIVQYMLQNSLGRYYHQLYPTSKLFDQWEFYLNEPQQNGFSPEATRLEDIRLIDPACGSGHILIEAFDLFYTMYEEQGYLAKEIPDLIIKNNLFGLEVDKRSYQVSHVALLLKILARQPRLLRQNNSFQFHITVFKDVTQPISIEALEWLFNSEEIDEIRELEGKFENATQFGSLLKMGTISINPLYTKLEKLKERQELDLYEQALAEELVSNLAPILKTAQLLIQSYTIVVTNPPYHNKYNSDLKKFMKINYPETKADLYSAFIEVCFFMTENSGYTAMMTPYTWMFISSHEKLRHFILENGGIANLVQLEYGAFEDAAVTICTFVLQKKQRNKKGTYIRLFDFKGSENQPLKVREAIINPSVSYRYEKNTDVFYRIPGAPIAYWVSENLYQLFSEKNYKSLGELYEVKSGIMTGDDKKHLRRWYEIDKTKLSLLNSTSNFEENTFMKKWFPINKGGGQRLYFGNHDYVIDLYKEGENIRYSKKNYRLRAKKYYFNKGITWSRISSSYFSFRMQDQRTLFGDASPLIVNGDLLLLGFLNSKVTAYLLKVLNPTVNTFVSDIEKLPILFNKSIEIEKLVKANIQLAKEDWDDFETSWEFKQHPFLSYQQNEKNLSRIFENWQQITTARIQQLTTNQKLINQYFIQEYQLTKELSPKVIDEELTLYRSNKANDVRSFLSYLIGITFGRYTLDELGLFFAGGKFDSNAYQEFQPDRTNIIPITSSGYFEDDIVKQIEKLVSYLFGESMLEVNLQFIGEGLGLKKDEEARERIRSYFMKEFYKDHLKIYQKRPIYWLFNSGKKEAFKGLIYVHRYDKQLTARLRTDYLLQLITTLGRLEEYTNQIIEINETPRAVVKARKDREKYNHQLVELRNYHLFVEYFANQEMEIDLDEGIIMNHQKFGLPQFLLTNRKDKKMNHLFEKID